MSDVSINIRGRDDGLGNQLDSLRQKAQDLGKDISELNNLSDLTPTEQKVKIGKFGSDVSSGLQDNVRSEYADLRKSNLDEFSETEAKFKSGEIDKKTFDKYKGEFDANQKGLRQDEDSEILEIDKEISQTLREIHKEMVTESKIERERRQRDNTEHKAGGLSGSILEENKELRNLQHGSTDEAEISEIQAKIDSNNERLRGLRRGTEDGEDSPFAFREIGGSLASAGRGDLSGTVQGGLQAGGKMTGMVQGFTIAGIVAMILKETVGHGESLMEALAPVSALRGGSANANASNIGHRTAGGDFSQDGRFDLGALGLKNTDMAAMMREKALSSGKSDDDLFGRTYKDQAFNKAFGADVSMFSQFERFTKGQEDAGTIAMDVLNVLTSIDKSSLKENDLTTLTEKLTAQNTILSLQRQKRDSVDVDSSLQILAAFENIGLSQKGEKSGNFLNQTLQGLGEGGSDNLMMLKFEAAKRARPDLANDPAALRRLVKFNPDNPEYMGEAFKMFGDMTGGNDMAMDDLIYSFFNPESEADMEMYKKAMKGGDFQDILGGKGLNAMKQRKSSLDEETMMLDAESGVGEMTKVLSDFSNRSQGVIDEFMKIVGGIITGQGVNVNLVKDDTKTRSNGVSGNQYKTGN